MEWSWICKLCILVHNREVSENFTIVSCIKSPGWVVGGGGPWQCRYVTQPAVTVAGSGHQCRLLAQQRNRRIISWPPAPVLPWPWPGHQPPTCPHQNSSCGRVQTWNNQQQGLSCCGGVFNLCSLTQIFWDFTNFDDFSLGPVVGSSKIFKSLVSLWKA